MADWITCSSCGLKHSARPDGICPRCQAPAGGAFVPPVYAGPDAPGAPPLPVPPPYAVAPATPSGFPLGARLAGWVLYANAVVAIVGMIRAGASPAEPGSGFGGVVPLLIDVLVGTFLVAGREKAQVWAVVRVGLGAVIFTPILWSNAGPMMGLMQLAFSLGLLILLIGRPGPIRMALGLASAGGVLSLLLGVLLQQPLAVAARDLMAGTLDRSPHVEAVEGRDGRWRLTLPPDHWHESSKLPPNVERAFSWPEHGAGVFVTVNTLPGGQVDVERIAEAFFTAMGRAVPGLRIVEQQTVSTAAGTAVIARVTVAGKAPEDGWIGVHAVPGMFGVAAASAPGGASPEVLDELHAIAGSLELVAEAP